MEDPCINYLECYHESCHCKFTFAEDLIKHLQNHKCYTRNFHQSHEDVVCHQSLTPEKILQKEISRCPAYICDKGKTVFTPQELCNHFAILGISPFWKKGMDFKTIANDLNTNLDKKIYVEPDCIFCYTEKPDTIFLTCNHTVFCIDCYKKTTKCPICRTVITRVLPF